MGSSPIANVPINPRPNPELVCQPLMLCVFLGCRNGSRSKWRLDTYIKWEALCIGWANPRSVWGKLPSSSQGRSEMSRPVRQKHHASHLLQLFFQCASEIVAGHGNQKMVVPQHHKPLHIHAPHQLTVFLAFRETRWSTPPAQATHPGPDHPGHRHRFRHQATGSGHGSPALGGERGWWHWAPLAPGSSVGKCSEHRTSVHRSRGGRSYSRLFVTSTCINFNSIW